METYVRKIGNSLGYIIPSVMIKQFKLEAGTKLKVKFDNNKMIVEPVKNKKHKFFTLEELLDGNIYTADDNLTAKPLNSEWID